MLSLLIVPCFQGQLARKIKSIIAAKERYSKWLLREVSRWWPEDFFGLFLSVGGWQLPTHFEKSTRCGAGECKIRIQRISRWNVQFLFGNTTYPPTAEWLGRTWKHSFSFPQAPFYLTSTLLLPSFHLSQEERQTIGWHGERYRLHCFKEGIPNGFLFLQLLFCTSSKQESSAWEVSFLMWLKCVWPSRKKEGSAI